MKGSEEQIATTQLEPLLLRAELLLERALALRSQDQDKRSRELAWVALELEGCEQPLQTLGITLEDLIEQIGAQRQDSVSERWQAQLQQGLQQLHSVNLRIEELLMALDTNQLPTQDRPLVERPERQLQELLARRQRHVVALEAEVKELRAQCTNQNGPAEAGSGSPEDQQIPSLFDEQLAD